jgi:hypothetical protein
MRRSIVYRAGVGFAVAMLAPRVQATEADALAIDSNIQAIHLP